MKDKHENLTIKINAKLGTIKMSGTRRQVEEADEKMNEILKKITNKTVSKSPLFLKLISEKEVAIANWLKNFFFFLFTKKDFFIILFKSLKRLKEVPIQCVLEADLNQNKLFIYTTDQANAEKFLNEARFEIIEKEFDLCLIENKSKLSDLLNEIDAQDDIVTAETDKSYLKFCGFKNKVDDIYGKLCELA